MIKGCREPPYPSILTDATMEKLALAKFVAQESKCEVRTRGGEAVVPEMRALVSGSRGADSGLSCFPSSACSRLSPPPQPSRLPSWGVSSPCPLPPQATAVTVRFYGLVHWEDPQDEFLGPTPCHCSPPEGTITKEGMLHYKAGTSYLGKEHWKTCFVVLR